MLQMNNLQVMSKWISKDITDKYLDKSYNNYIFKYMFIFVITLILFLPLSDGAMTGTFPRCDGNCNAGDIEDFVAYISPTSATTADILCNIDYSSNAIRKKMVVVYDLYADGSLVGNINQWTCLQLGPNPGCVDPTYDGEPNDIATGLVIDSIAYDPTKKYELKRVLFLWDTNENAGCACNSNPVTACGDYPTSKCKYQELSEIYPALNIEINPVSTCLGTPVVLDLDVSGGSGEYEILWSTDPTLSCLNCEDPIANPTTTTTYSVLVTDQDELYGQSASASVVVTVHPNPVAVASSNTPVCEGDTIDLTGGPDGMVSYSWIGPDDFHSFLQNPKITEATSSKSGTYILTVEDENGCTDTESTDITVEEKPIISAGVDQYICVIESSTVSLIGTNTGGPASYIWTSSGSPYRIFNPTSLVGAVYTPSTTDVESGYVVITLTATGTGACTGPFADDMKVFLFKRPIPTISYVII